MLHYVVLCCYLVIYVYSCHTRTQYETPQPPTLSQLWGRNARGRDGDESPSAKRPETTAKMHTDMDVRREETMCGIG